MTYASARVAASRLGQSFSVLLVVPGCDPWVGDSEVCGLEWHTPRTETAHLLGQAGKGTGPRLPWSGPGPKKQFLFRLGRLLAGRLACGVGGLLGWCDGHFQADLFQHGHEFLGLALDAVLLHQTA